jgi:hypothetical protein
MADGDANEGESSARFDALALCTVRLRRAVVVYLNPKYAIAKGFFSEMGVPRLRR